MNKKETVNIHKGNKAGNEFSELLATFTLS